MRKGSRRIRKRETFAALRLDIDSWRWRGVPFYIRAGKCLPVTCTEVTARLRKPPTMFEGYKLTRITCGCGSTRKMCLHFGLMSVCEGEENVGQSLESIASRHRCPTEMDAYERLLVDAMTGDATHFAREDYVEEAWRIVDPVLKAGTPVTRVRTGNLGAGRGRVTSLPAGRMGESGGHDGARTGENRDSPRRRRGGPRGCQSNRRFGTRRRLGAGSLSLR